MNYYRVITRGQNLVSEAHGTSSELFRGTAPIGRQDSQYVEDGRTGR